MKTDATPMKKFILWYRLPSIRLKALILLMASSGIHIGAISGLQLSHLEKRGDLFKINVYKGQKGKGQSYTFCTPECAKAIDTYLEFRERCGEKITPSSLLFRKDFNSDDPSQARFQIEQWNKKAITRVMTKALVRSGLVTVDHVNGTASRKEAMMTHGFRKFFETMLVNSNIHETIIRKLTGHSDSPNLTQLYSKQTEPEMLIQYQKSTDLLTIDPANRLRKKVEYFEEEKTKFDRLAAQVAALEAKIK